MADNNRLDWLSQPITLPNELVEAIIQSESEKGVNWRRLAANLDLDQYEELGIQSILNRLDKEPDRVKQLIRARDFVNQHEKRGDVSFHVKVNSFAFLREEELELLRNGFVPLGEDSPDQDRNMDQASKSKHIEVTSGRVLEDDSLQVISEDDYILESSKQINAKHQYKSRSRPYISIEQIESLPDLKDQNGSSEIESETISSEDDYLLESRRQKETHSRRALEEDLSQNVVSEDDYLLESSKQIKANNYPSSIRPKISIEQIESLADVKDQHDSIDMIAGESITSEDDYLFESHHSLVGKQSHSRRALEEDLLSQGVVSEDDYLLEPSVRVKASRYGNHGRPRIFLEQIESLPNAKDQASSLDTINDSVGSEDDYLFESGGYSTKKRRLAEEVKVPQKSFDLEKDTSSNTNDRWKNQNNIEKTSTSKEVDMSFGRIPRSRDPEYHRNLVANVQTNDADVVNWIPYLPDVKFQGFSCGGCWAFALTGLIEGHFNKNATTPGLRISLSEQYALDCDRARNRGCEGGNYYHSLRGGFLAEKGLPLGSEVPFTFSGSTANSCSSPAALKLDPGSDTFVDKTEEALMEALRHGPVAVALSSYNPTFQYYSSGILDDAVGCGTKLDHAALLVGFGVDSDSKKKYWLVRNSWGSAWGENGYVRLLRGDPKVLEVTGGLGMCGILAQANTLTRPPYLVDPIRSSEALKDPRFCTKEYGCISTNVTMLGGIPKAGGFDNPIGSVEGRATIIVSSIVAVLALLGIGAAIWWLRRERRRTHTEETLIKLNSSWWFSPNWSNAKPKESELESSSTQAAGQNRVSQSLDEDAKIAYTREVSFSPRHLFGIGDPASSPDAYDLPGSPARSPTKSPTKSPLRIFAMNNNRQVESEAEDDPESPTKCSNTIRRYSSPPPKSYSRRLFEPSLESDPETPPHSPERPSNSPLRNFSPAPIRPGTTSPIRSSTLRSAYSASEEDTLY